MAKTKSKSKTETLTIKEALERRIPRVREARWANPHAYLRLPLMADGMHGPWAELYDDRTQEEVLDVRPGSQRVLVIGLEGDFEVYQGPVSPHEQDPENFARSYLEK